MAKTRSEIKNSLDALLRTGLCLVWITGAILMVVKWLGHQVDPENVTLSVQAAICAVVTIAAISAHAFLVDQKTKETEHE